MSWAAGDSSRFAATHDDADANAMEQAPGPLHHRAQAEGLWPHSLRQRLDNHRHRLVEIDVGTWLFVFDDRGLGGLVSVS